MSLKLMRRYQRALLIGTAIIIIPAFVLLYGQNSGPGGGGVPSGAAGTIGDETVSMGQVYISLFVAILNLGTRFRSSKEI